MENKYYIVDYGKEVTDLAQLVINNLREDEHHVLVALTNLEKYLSIEEITQDDFLDYFDLMNKANEN